MKHHTTLCYLFAVAWLGLLSAGCSGAYNEPAEPAIEIEFNDSLFSRVDAKLDGRQIAVAGYGTSEFISISGNDVKEFTKHLLLEVKPE